MVGVDPGFFTYSNLCRSNREIIFTVYSPLDHIMVRTLRIIKNVHVWSNRRKNDRSRTNKSPVSSLRRPYLSIWSQHGTYFENDKPRLVSSTHLVTSWGTIHRLQTQYSAEALLTFVYVVISLSSLARSSLQRSSAIFLQVVDKASVHV